jgi:hypothetical protein
MKYYVLQCDDDFVKCTHDLNEARKWRDDFIANGIESYIVDIDNNLIY